MLYQVRMFSPVKWWWFKTRKFPPSLLQEEEESLAGDMILSYQWHGSFLFQHCCGRIHSLTCPHCFKYMYIFLTILGLPAICHNVGSCASPHLKCNLKPGMLTDSISINAVLLSSAPALFPTPLSLSPPFLSDGSLTQLTRLTPPISFYSARSLFRLDSWLAAVLQCVITVWFDRRQGVVSNQTEKRSWRR